MNSKQFKATNIQREQKYKLAETEAEWEESDFENMNDNDERD